MPNMNYKKKYHYIVKYILIAFPLLLLLLSNISYSNFFINMKELVYSAMVELRGFSINDFYNTIIDVLGFDITSKLNYILVTYPLYIFWVYLLDLILDVLTFIPKLAHKFLYKFVSD